MKRAGTFLASLILFAGSLSADTVETFFFRQNLTTANEVPPVQGVTASARAIIAAHVRRNDAGTVVSGVVDFDIDYSFTDAVSVVGLHIYDGPAGVNGPVVIDSGLSGTNTVAAQGTGNITRQVVVESGAALAALIGLLGSPDGFYVNLRTTTFSGGIIRAQLVRAELLVLRGILDPANEVPPIQGLDASGSASVFIVANRNERGVITEGTVTYNASYRFPGPVTLTGMHIHPAAEGENGPAILNSGLARTDSDVQDVTAGTLRRRFEVTSGVPLDALRLIISNPAGGYFNIHTTVNSGGAMRGQLQRTTETSFQAVMSPAQEVPPIIGLNASGLGKVSMYVTRNAAGTVTSGTAIFDVTYRFPGNVELTGFHIHTGPAGTNGPDVIDSGISDANSLQNASGVGNLYRIIDVGSTNAPGLAALRSIVVTPANQYINLHTTVNPDGAIRAQLVSGTPRAPAISSGGVVNATNAARVAAASPGSLVSIYGANLAQATAVAGSANGRLPTNLEGTEVRIGAASAPLLYISPNQINAQVPFETQAGNQPVTVITAGGTSAVQTVSVTPVSPAIFVVVRNSDFSLITSSNPARSGDELAIFAAGLGAVTPAVASGQLAPLSPLSSVSPAPTITIGGVAATLTSPSAVLAPGFVGVYQANVRVAAGTPAGSQSLVLTTGGQPSNSVSVVIQ